MSRPHSNDELFDGIAARRPSRQRRTTRRYSTLRQAGKVVLAFVIFGAAAIWIGERLEPRWTGGRAPAFWLEGQGPWAPDYGRCAGCGRFLVPSVDAISACRYCERSGARYRHPSLPKTLEEQEQVWK